MSGSAVLVYKAHPRLLPFSGGEKSAPYIQDYTVCNFTDIIRTEICLRGRFQHPARYMHVSHYVCRCIYETKKGTYYIPAS